jgi:predicted TIM-barrel fold metal-dependent hydrolase
VFSTDYPHGDSQYPHAVAAFDKLPWPDDTKAKIVGPNWERLYKIPLRKAT